MTYTLKLCIYCEMNHEENCRGITCIEHNAAIDRQNLEFTGIIREKDKIIENREKELHKSIDNLQQGMSAHYDLQRQLESERGKAKDYEEALEKLSNYECDCEEAYGDCDAGRMAQEALNRHKEKK